MAESAVVEHVVTFGRVLRAAGLEVGPGRVSDALRGLAVIDLRRQDDVYWTLRQTLASRVEDLETFDRAFSAWFLRVAAAPRPAKENMAMNGLWPAANWVQGVTDIRMMRAPT